MYLLQAHYQWLLDYPAGHFETSKERIHMTDLFEIAMDLLIEKCRDNPRFVQERTKNVAK